MRFNRWKIEVKLLPLIDTSDKWLYHFHFNFVPFVLAITDLGGKIILFNIMFIWSKMFWREK